ncbi:hypothetical protein ACM44_02700 [Chryseobacterium koreense CCUG 49689]|uniref:Uncharacterized protein n=1 Tax=Chryseobacterium koreense CCUG 49689 TaxID=1304281 RepID=A0A0J7J2T0_9FLAO|nr:hypothetical protein ACM44_02700 [Chryseobacterium koreense CCUG 49689]
MERLYRGKVFQFSEEVQNILLLIFNAQAQLKSSRKDLISILKQRGFYEIPLNSIKFHKIWVNY